MKVAVEISMIATNAEAVPTGEDIIAIAGTGPRGYEKGGGADTAIVIRSSRSDDFCEQEMPKESTKAIREIICKPR
jgi:hypothetical protein